jgi:hypothetical protein
LLATVLHAPSALSQVRPGASLTVVRGSVAVTRSDGTAIYPAGTGLTLAIGDVVGTLERTRAIVTFFSGSEVELGSNTTVVIRRLDRDLLDQANVTVEHLSGAMLIRVPTEDGPNPGVRVLGNDTVAVIRAGEIGHGVDPTSNNVTVACVDGEWRCLRDSVTFPNATTILLGQTALTVTGAGDLIPFRVARGASIWDALAEGAALGQPDGTDGASNPVPSQRERAAAEEDDAKPVQPVPPNGTPTPAPTTTRTPTVTPTGTLTPSATPFPTATPPPGTPGPQCNVQWADLIRPWTQDDSFSKANTVATYLELRGLPALLGKLRQAGIRYVVTGSQAASTLAPVTAPRLLSIYVDNLDDRANEFHLRPAERGANVVLAEPFNVVVFERTLQVNGIRYAAPHRLLPIC